MADRVAALSPNDWRHGTQGGYTNHKCRCAPCKAAHAEMMRNYRTDPVKRARQLELNKQSRDRKKAS